MSQFVEKLTKTYHESKRHFTVVMGGKEHGLYVSSTPSSAAKKAVTKLCAANKSKKVEFCSSAVRANCTYAVFVFDFEGYILVTI